MQELYDRMVYRLAKEAEGDFDDELRIDLLDLAREYVADEEIKAKASEAIHAHYGYQTEDEEEF